MVGACPGRVKAYFQIGQARTCPGQFKTNFKNGQARVAQNSMEYFVYILKSKKDGALYTGYTADLKERLKAHNSGKVRSTKSKIPWDIVYFERHPSLESVLTRERYLKSSKSKRLKESLRGKAI